MASQGSIGNITLITIPAGTILFRGIRIPEDPLAFYTDYLGTPVDGALCLKPTHNVFFYAHPLVSFGVHEVGKTYDAMQVVVLVKDVQVICLMRPSSLVRGSPKGFPSSAPIQRCSVFKESCTQLTEKEVDALSYDNCLLPSYQRSSGTRGWMAIANMDSIEPAAKEAGFEGTMAPYLRGLEKRFPGVGSLLAASTYMDATRAERGKQPRNGFPEVVLYPYATAPSDTNLYQECTSETMAMALLSKHAKNDNLLYLPLATVTQSGVVDMVSGHFSFGRLKVQGQGQEPNQTNQTKVEKNLLGYLNMAMRHGVRVPYYGNGAISFDKRTGFYVLPQVASSKETLIPMDSKDPKMRPVVYETMRKYLVTVRNPDSTFAFARPAVAPVFRAVGISLPKDMYEYVKGSAATASSVASASLASASVASTSLPSRQMQLQKAGQRTTRRIASKASPLVRYANNITNLWKIHAKNKAVM
jgi:hypothetical protein